MMMMMILTTICTLFHRVINFPIKKENSREQARRKDSVIYWYPNSCPCSSKPEPCFLLPNKSGENQSSDSFFFLFPTHLFFFVSVDTVLTQQPASLTQVIIPKNQKPINQSIYSYKTSRRYPHKKTPKTLRVGTLVIFLARHLSSCCVPQ